MIVNEENVKLVLLKIKSIIDDLQKEVDYGDDKLEVFAAEYALEYNLLLFGYVCGAFCISQEEQEKIIQSHSSAPEKE